MANKQKISTALLAIGIILLLVAAIMPLVSLYFSWLKYIYATGAALTLIARLIDRYTGNNITLKRLNRILICSSICYCVSAVILFDVLRNYVAEKDWLAFLLAGAVLQIYATFRIESEEKNEAKKNCKN